MEPESLLARLAPLDTPAICDAEKSLSLGLGIVDPSIRPLVTGLKMVGRAHTVRCHNDFLAVLHGLQQAKTGDVLVIDSQNSDLAVSGSLFPTEALRKGLAGIINDGPCRDTAVVRTLGLPYYARSVHCRAGSTTTLGETGIPVHCGGVTVHPGDIVFGDDDGIVIASASLMAELLPVAERIQDTERQLVDQMAAGRSLTDMMNLDEHLQALAEGHDTTLSFCP
ncbi:MAG: dimethylmenaquinone methyltransferase [Planctomycetaceae bacterium]|jgi:regulator of RNase E activity RraA|nr:dimethylmenaquinone methyltransferase [Planctomycetaceae bacterium]MDP7275448.1 RraA family protein [Planctomycetaceae bacterium]